MKGTAARQAWATPARHPVPAGANATDDVFDRAARSPRDPAFGRKAGGVWQTVTAGQFADQVAALAAGLMAAGIRPGDRIALMSSTRYEWGLCDFAIMAAGAVTVPIYETSAPSQVAWILADSGAVAVFVENQDLRDVVEKAIAESGRAAVESIWQFDHGDLAGLAARGARIAPEQVAQRRGGVGAEDLATIVYTSGTTGRPKGCRLTHRCLVAEVNSMLDAEGVRDQVLGEHASLLLFLPLAHILARVVQMAAFRHGVRIGHLNDLRRVAVELRAFQPTVLLAVPRVFEKLYHTAARQAEASGHGKLFRAAERAAVAYSQAMETGDIAPGLRTRRWLYDRPVYAKLRAATGGRVAYAISGGAPLSPRLGHFLRGAGITVLEGYGLTETSSAVTLNLPRAQRIGTVGRPLPGYEVRIADDGEVLVRGSGVFAGYWRNAAATEEALTGSGWFHTGDLGRLDDGYLTITGRRKDILVTAAGKNVSPAVHEDMLRSHWLIDHCVLVGDRRPYLAALISLDREALAQWRRERGGPAETTGPALRADPALRAAIQAAVDEVNATVSKAEQIKRFRIVDAEFTVGDELTPTQKVRRDRVLAKLSRDVAAVYAPVPPP